MLTQSWFGRGSGRHLSPAVVARIAAQPGLTRLPGVARAITALFTDIAGFSPYTEALSPSDLIAIPDRYFAGLTLIVHAHGGMVDKFVGDAAHVLFNAPFDQPDHCAQAVNAGQALQAYGVTFAADPMNQGLGIIRVGMECGVLVVSVVCGAIRIRVVPTSSIANRDSAPVPISSPKNTTACATRSRAGLPPKLCLGWFPSRPHHWRPRSAAAASPADG